MATQIPFLRWTLPIRIYLAVLWLPAMLAAQVPHFINYQGRVTSNGTNFEGPGQFKFSLVNSNGTTTFWSNDGTGVGGNEPTNAVVLSVDKGLFVAPLGSQSLTNMTPIAPTIFTNPDVRLRIWFSVSATNFQLLSPDQRIGAVGYAMVADNVADGSVTAAKLADGSITSSKLAVQAVQAVNIADGAVTEFKLAAGLSGSVQRIVRGVISFSGSNYERTDSFSPSVDPTKSYVLLGPAVLNTTPGASGVSFGGRNGAVLISLNASSITVAVDYNGNALELLRVSYQIIELK